MSSSYLTVPRPRRQRTLSAFDYGSIEVHDDDKDGDYANAEDEDVTEDEDLENDTGTMKTNQFQRIERRVSFSDKRLVHGSTDAHGQCRRSPAPSPEGLPNVAATSTRKTGKKMEKKRQEVRVSLYAPNGSNSRTGSSRRHSLAHISSMSLTALAGDDGTSAWKDMISRTKSFQSQKSSSVSSGPCC